MYDEWKWWSGRDGEIFTHGPLDSREDAIDEAFGQEDFGEEQLPDGSWVGHVYVAEMRGTYYECDECGVVEKACAGCDENLDYSEPRFFFKNQRNTERVTRPIPA